NLLAVTATYSNGTKLLGIARNFGVEPHILFLFSAGKFTSPADFSVRAKVEHPPTWSTLPMADKEADMGLGFRINPAYWTENWLYSHKIVLRHRPGTERFYGSFSGSGAPSRIDGPPMVTLATMGGKD